MKRWMLVLGAVLALIVVGGAGYLGTRSTQQENTPSVETPTTVEVTRGDVQQTVTAPGQLVGTCQVTLALDVSGKLAEVHARPGEHVQAGDVLAQVDPARVTGAVAPARGSTLIIIGMRLPEVSRNRSSAVFDQRRGLTAVYPRLKIGWSSKGRGATTWAIS